MTDAVAIHVTRYAMLQEVGDAYRSGATVDLWLDEADGEVARRAIDFAFGMTYATGGTLRKVEDWHLRLVPGPTPGGGTGDREPRGPLPVAGAGAAEMPEPEFWPPGVVAAAPVTGKAMGELAVEDRLTGGRRTR